MIIDICGKRISEYIVDILAKFNRGMNDLKIRAIGGNISKGIEIAHILSKNKKFNVEIASSEIKSFTIVIKEKEIQIPGVEITLKRANMMPTNSGATIQEQSAHEEKTNFEFEFVDFPTYHLLLDWLLFSKKEIKLVHDNKPLLTISLQNDTIKCEIDQSIINERNKIEGIRDAFYRCGLLFLYNWKDIFMKLSGFDDVILGIDTNILYTCTITEHLLPVLSLMELGNNIQTPNWILFVIPKDVMREIEESANIRDDKGFLKTQGRMGFRALQEIIELNRYADTPGVSLLIFGEVKSFTGDLLIRDQFKNFLQRLNFHKGVYFLTADKTNSALAHAEGINPILFRLPYEYYERHLNSPFSFYEIDVKNAEKIKIEVPIGKLLYEMAVQFSVLNIPINNSKQLIIQCDAKGENLDNWLFRKLRINGLEALRGQYSGIDLKEVSKIWNDLAKKFII
jgi:DNA-binding protein